MQLSFWIVILLAVVQGLTEYLPVSSSGHLVLVETMFGLRGEGGLGGVMFEVAVHVGTLAAVLYIYRRRIGSLIRSAGTFTTSGFRIYWFNKFFKNYSIAFTFDSHLFDVTI